MLSDDVRNMAAALRHWQDPETGRLVLEPEAARVVLDQLSVIRAALRFIEAIPMPPTARLCGELPDGVVDLAAVRRRRRRPWQVITTGPAA
jgi:hypothetical protein